MHVVAYCPIWSFWSDLVVFGGRDLVVFQVVTREA
jgi:hypothetical protein